MSNGRDRRIAFLVNKDKTTTVLFFFNRFFFLAFISENSESN